MKPKKTRKKPEPKKTKPKILRRNDHALTATANDDYWQIDITVSSASGVELSAIMVRPFPPPPPINPADIVGWMQRSIMGE